MSQQDNNINQYRRQFLSTTSALAGLSLAPGVLLTQVAHAADKGPASDKNRWGLLIDSAKCATGCNACVTACHKENGVPVMGNPETDAQWIRKVKLTDKQTGHVQSLPLMCQHCEKPPCVDVCPTNASIKREDGVVLVDKHACIGCRYCMMACPYNARSFVHEKVTEQIYPRGKGTVESCTLCVHRIDESHGTRNPACVEACNAEGHKAMWFGDLKDPHSEISLNLKKYGGEQIRADLGLNTGVRYQNIS